MTLTVVSSRNTPTTLSVDKASILLQAGVGHAALAVGHRAVLVLGNGRGHGDQAEDEGGETELHFGGFGLVKRKETLVLQIV